VTLTYERATGRETAIGSPVSVIRWEFTSDATGIGSAETETVSGTIKRVVTNPDDNVLLRPTAGWNLTIEDEDGVDVLCGNGLNRDANGTGASQQAFPCPGNLAVASRLTFRVANAGNTKKAVIKLYII